MVVKKKRLYSEVVNLINIPIFMTTTAITQEVTTMLIDMVSSITILVQTSKYFEMQNKEEATVKVARSYSPTEIFPTCPALCMSRVNS